MLSLAGPPSRCCEGLTRRQWLTIGGLSTLGIGLPELWQARAQARDRPGPRSPAAYRPRAKSCVVVFLFGAPAHQDTWDLKPDAPAEVRGEFKPIGTSVPGTWISEHMPRLAAAADRYAIVRSVSHPDNTHTVAMHYMLTGVRHAAPSTNPRNDPSDFPTFGSVLSYLRPSADPLPRSISLNAPANQVSAGNFIFPGFFAGFLGTAHDPLFVPQDPSAADFELFGGSQPLEDAAGRRSLLAEVNRQAEALQRAASARRMDPFYERALDLLSSPATRRACDLGREPPRLRDRYGRTAFGQGLLLARRLVEAGVSLVTVNWARDDAFWDTHKNNFVELKTNLLPPFDLGFSAFLEDLDARGLLDETLVVCLAEFGRTPKINAAAGRDHWAQCFSLVLAGAGIRAGQVYGSSDRTGAYPHSNPVSPADLSATIYASLGIDPQSEIRDRLGRSYRLSLGRPIEGLF